MVREKLRTTTAVQGRAYDVVAHQQAATPEQLLAPLAASPEDDDQEPEAGARSRIDLTALRELKASRTDVEALDFTAEQLRRVTDAFTKAGDGARARTQKHADRVDTTPPRPVHEDDQRAHRPQQPDRQRGLASAFQLELWAAERDCLGLCRAVGMVTARRGVGFSEVLGSRWAGTAGQLAGRGSAARRWNAAASSCRQGQVADMRRRRRRPPRVIRAPTCRSR